LLCSLFGAQLLDSLHSSGSLRQGVRRTHQCASVFFFGYPLLSWDFSLAFLRLQQPGWQSIHVAMADDFRKGSFQVEDGDTPLLSDILTQTAHPRLASPRKKFGFSLRLETVQDKTNQLIRPSDHPQMKRAGKKGKIFSTPPWKEM